MVVFHLEINHDIQEIVESITYFYHPEKIILFGSYAKGTATVRSDIDLLVIKDTDEPFRIRGRLLKQVFFQSIIPIDLLIYTNEEIGEFKNHPYSFISSVLNTGIEVYSKAMN